MADQTNNEGSRQTFLAGEAITANRLVKFSAAASGRVTVIMTTAIADDALGTAQETVANGEDVVVECGNGRKMKMVAKSAITAGQQVMPDAGGVGKVATAAGATAKSVGIALSSAAADGETLEVLTRYGANGPLNA